MTLAQKLATTFPQIAKPERSVRSLGRTAIEAMNFKLRQVLSDRHRDYAQAFDSARRIYRFYRDCGCSMRVAVSRVILGRDPYQWLLDENEKLRRAEWYVSMNAEGSRRAT